jgi:alkaline phosphatase D
VGAIGREWNTSNSARITVPRYRPMPELFDCGVASGDPLPDAIVLWTHVATGDAEVPVAWSLARDPEMTDVIAAGTTAATAAHDHTVHVDVAGLEPATAYWYRFDASGASSPVGRTRTLAGDDTEHLRFALCSCAKFNAGYFNAYRRIAVRDDLAFLLHLGDYIYEASQTPPVSQTPSADIGRPFEPLEECRTLEQYRQRYHQYHRDPDLQALHRSLPIIATWDDHELADGAWAGGATEHRPDEHGPWADRRAAALQARWEWVPGRQPDPADPSRVFRSVAVGGLADLLLIDIRSRRDEPAEEPGMSEPGRSILGEQQRSWLFDALEGSSAAWRFLCSPSLLSQTWCADPDENLAMAMVKLKLMGPDGTGPDVDQWDGYPAERQRLLGHLREQGIADTVVLSADIHVSMAAEVHERSYEKPVGEPLAVEFVSPSLTSQNLADKLKLPRHNPTSRQAEDAFVHALDHVHWCDMDSHGYVVVDVDPTRVTAEWWHLDTVSEPSSGETLGAAFTVTRGTARAVRTDTA